MITLITLMTLIITLMTLITLVVGVPASIEANAYIRYDFGGNAGGTRYPNTIKQQLVLINPFYKPGASLE